MCFDFTDLNKVLSKDSYPLPNIDSFVDNASGGRLLSFLDTFWGIIRFVCTRGMSERQLLWLRSPITAKRLCPLV